MYHGSSYTVHLKIDPSCQPPYHQSQSSISREASRSFGYWNPDPICVGILLIVPSHVQEQLNMNATFGHWLSQNQQVQPQPQPQPQPPQALPPKEVQADRFKPATPPAPQQLVDEILSPSQLAPPPAAAVGPPPRRLATAGSSDQPEPLKEAGPFQKVCTPSCASADTTYLSQLMNHILHTPALTQASFFSVHVADS